MSIDRRVSRCEMSGTACDCDSNCISPFGILTILLTDFHDSDFGLFGFLFSLLISTKINIMFLMERHQAIFVVDLIGRYFWNRFVILFCILVSTCLIQLDSGV